MSDAIARSEGIPPRSRRVSGNASSADARCVRVTGNVPSEICEIVGNARRRTSLSREARFLPERDDVKVKEDERDRSIGNPRLRRGHID
jgi:hypothetical protein